MASEVEQRDLSGVVFSGATSLLVLFILTTAHVAFEAAAIASIILFVWWSIILYALPLKRKSNHFGYYAIGVAVVSLMLGVILMSLGIHLGYFESPFVAHR